MNELVISSAFDSQLRKLLNRNPSLRAKISQILRCLIRNINHSSLKLHKLSGESIWSVSVTYSIRLIIFIDGKKIYCLRIGTYDEVY